MWRFGLYLLMVVIAYLAQSVWLHLLLPAGLWVDFCLLLVVRASFGFGIAPALLLALVAGAFMDIGMPPGMGFHPMYYALVAVGSAMLWNKLNLQDRRFQAILVGLATLAHGLSLWALFGSASAAMASLGSLLATVGGRTLAAAALTPLFFAILDRLERRLAALEPDRRYQQP